MTRSVRFGFLTHLQGQKPPRDLFRDAIETFREAERLGFSSGWIAQHHLESGRTGPGAAAAPLTILTAVAENTRRIRLGTAVITIPLESPLRLAEDAATLDLISGGRLELGVGSGYDDRTFRAFGVPFDDRREATSRGLETLFRAFRGQTIDAEGTAVLHPQAPDLANRLWQAVFSHEGARYAAGFGTNLLLNRATYGYDEPTDEVQRPWADTFLEAWDQHAANGGRAPQIGLSRFVFAAKDRETARRIVGEGVDRAADYMVAQGKFPKGLDLDGYLARLHAFIGHPDDIAEQLAKEKVLPVVTDILCQSNPGVPDHEQVLESLSLIATKVAPALGWSLSAPQKQAEPA